MAVRQHAARVGAGDDGDACIRQFFHRISASQRSAAQPQQRLFCLLQLRPECVNYRGVHGGDRRRFHRCGHQRKRNIGTLNINRDLNRDRPARRRLRVLNRFVQDSYRLVGVADAVRPFGAGLQEGQLVAGFMDKSGIGIQPGFFDLSG